VPIVKKAIDKQQFTQSQIIDKSSLLYEGTELVQLCSHSSNPVHTAFNEYGLMVMVTRSNFSTMKGQLIRIITFPRSRSIKFYTESAKFIAFLFCLAIISYAILIAKLRAYVDTDDLVTKFFDLITITVPPGLPASMSVGIVYSLNKLKNKNIYCISPDKIILGGRVEHICFDKTGTLTEEFMDFYEFVPKMGKDFQNPIRLTNKNTPENQRNLSTPDSINALDNMASCHSIMNLEGDNRLMGDPMEIKLF
jgi:cation-transporting ATPase 13A2